MLVHQVSQTDWPSGPPDRVNARGTHLVVGWPSGQERSVPAIWLRDNCRCDECRIVPIGEHRYFLGQVAEAPGVRACAVSGDGALTVSWSDGHTSRFAPHDFVDLCALADRSHPPARLWADDFHPETFDRDEVLGDFEIRLRFFDASIRDGMTVVTNMGSESGECIRFLEALSVPIRDTPFDRLHDVFFRSDGYNVAHTDEPLPPHNDFASYQWPPSGQLIHMLVNEVEGGDWVNVDGFKVLAQLQADHPEALTVLARVQVPFREHSDSAESWTKAPLVRLDSHGNIAGIRFSNQLMRPLSPCDPDVEAFYEAYHLLAKAVMDPANQIAFRGNSGDMQFLHGHRILHARRGFDGTTGTRHLQDTYFDFDDVASLAARLGGAAR